MIITESEMTFGSYPEEHCFYIETSNVYKAIKDDGVKIAEFLLFKQDKIPSIFIIEAKKSSPQPISQPNFDSYINDIKDKFSNSLALFIAIHLTRHNNSELSDCFKQLELSDVNFVLVLVVKNHKEKWLPPLLKALHKSLKSTSKIWNLKGIWLKVLNEEGAREIGLVSNNLTDITNNSATT